MDFNDFCSHGIAFSALTLLVGWQEGHPARKKYGGWWMWALVSPDGVAPRRMVSVSASVNLPLHHKIQKFSSDTGSPGWSRKKGRKTVVVCGGGGVCMKFVPLTRQTIRCFKFVRRNLSVLLKMDKFIEEKFIPLHAKDWSYGCWCQAATIECMTSLISRVIGSRF